MVRLPANASSVKAKTLIRDWFSITHVVSWHFRVTTTFTTALGRDKFYVHFSGTPGRTPRTTQCFNVEILRTKWICLIHYRRTWKCKARQRQRTKRESHTHTRSAFLVVAPYTSKYAEPTCPVCRSYNEELKITKECTTARVFQVIKPLTGIEMSLARINPTGKLCEAIHGSNR